MQWFRSKVDWWLIPLLILPPVASVVVSVAFFLQGKMSELPWGIASLLFVACLYIGLVFPIRYGLDETQLIVRFGLCRQRIPLSRVVAVEPTRNPLSSPALSLDRLHIQYGQGIFKAVMISPKNRDQFLDELAQKTGLKRTGDRLVREDEELERR